MSNSINKKKLVAGFLLINILTGICAGIISMTLPLFALSIKASTAEIGIIRGISGIGTLIMVLPSGFLVDYFGSKKLYAFGSIVSAITIFFLAFSWRPELIMVFMAIQGFSNSLRFTSLNASFFRYLKQIGISKAGWYRGSMSIGLTFAGPLIGGYLLTYLSYKNIFIVASALTLLPLIALIPLIKGESARFNLKNEGLKQQKFSFISQLSELKNILKDKVLRQTVLAEGLSTACFSTFSTFIVVYAINKLSIKPYYSSWFLILEGTAYILVVFLGGRILYKYKRESLYLTSFSIMIGGLFFIAVSGKIEIIILGTTVLGIGIGVLNLVTYSNLSSVSGKKGKVSSLLSAATGIGSTFGPMFGGIIGEFLGYSAIFAVYIPLFTIVAIYIRFDNREKIEIILGKETA